MEAGLLAIAGGQPLQLVEAGSGEPEENHLLKDNPFERLMKAALEGENGEIPDESARGTVLDLLAVARQLAAGGVDATLQTELSEEQLKELQQEGLLAIVQQLDISSETFSLALSPLDLEGQVALWQIADSVSGSLALLPAQEAQAAMQLIADKNGSSLTLLPEQLGELGEDELRSLNEWLTALEQRYQAMEIDGLGGEVAAVPLVTFTPLPLPSWHALSRDANVVQLQLVDGEQGRALPVSTPLAGALATNDLSVLSDAELAELDTLIERISQANIARSGTAEDFRTQLTETLADKARGGTQEAAAPSALSASHAANQTRPHDGLSFRVLQANPAFESGQASPAEQARVTITQAAKAGMDRIVIQLDPPELGRIDVRLDLSSDGRTQLQIIADNRDTLDQLQRDARALERALQDAGLDANAQDMAFDLNERGEQEDQSGTDDALVEAYEETVEELRQPELALDPLTGSYTLSIAQGLDIKV